MHVAPSEHTIESSRLCDRLAWISSATDAPAGFIDNEMHIGAGWSSLTSYSWLTRWGDAPVAEVIHNVVHPLCKLGGEVGLNPQSRLRAVDNSWGLLHDEAVDPFEILEVGEVDRHLAALGAHLHADSRIEMVGEQLLELE